MFIFIYFEPWKANSCFERHEQRKGDIDSHLKKSQDLIKEGTEVRLKLKKKVSKILY